MEITGLDYQTLRNYLWVATHVALSRRRDALSFQHHAEVAALEAEEQDRWLSTAAGLKWSRNELRRQLRTDRRAAGGRTSDDVAIVLKIDAGRYAGWSTAADRAGVTLLEWIVEWLDRASRSASIGLSA